jgi:hypothetical protein
MRFSLQLIFILTVQCLCISAQARPTILTVGGGPEPSHDQLSLEQNVVFFRSVLDALGAGSLPQQVLFADGGKGDHTVQYLADDDDNTDFLSRLDYIASGSGEINLRYRKTELKDITGPATFGALTHWFETTGAAIPAGDELLFYYTGHGGADGSAANPPRNTTLALWDQPGMNMRQFTELLDKTNPAVDVMLIMVQCHSGGFANVMYKGGNPKNGLSPQLRFGFFSTTAPRMAAGCTADIRGSDYKEFSTAFFAALCGKKRTGESIEKPDYDHDGRTSYMDAFTYVLLTSDTIDLPMTSSDQLLRDFSKFALTPERRREGVRAIATTLPATTQAISRLLPANASFAEIDAAATPCQRAAIHGLAKVLKLDSADPVAAAKVLATTVDRQRRNAMNQSQASQRHFLDSREKLRHAIYLRYPELRDPWLPGSIALRDPANLPSLKKEIEALPEYKDFVTTSDAINQLDEKAEELERTWVKTQRLIERANTVILQANLPLVATPEIQARFKLLTERENGTLTAEHL